MTLRTHTRLVATGFILVYLSLAVLGVSTTADRLAPFRAALMWVLLPAFVIGAGLIAVAKVLPTEE
jgi:hypothetical protein